VDAQASPLPAEERGFMAGATAIHTFALLVQKKTLSAPDRP